MFVKYNFLRPRFYFIRQNIILTQKFLPFRQYYKINSYIMTIENKDTVDVSTVCNLLDKLTLKQLHLMEEKMRCEMNIESSIHSGSIHLAKARYIMGQNSVSTARLPMQNSLEFSASTVCETNEEDGVKQLKIVENSADNVVNPLRWFGVLIPQNMHKAQSIFQNALNYVVECANVQLQIHDNELNIAALKQYKTMLP